MQIKNRIVQINVYLYFFIYFTKNPKNKLFFGMQKNVEDARI